MDLKSSLDAWRGWSRMIASQDEEDLSEEFMLDAGSYPNRAVRVIRACRGWIPLADDDGGNHFGIDLFPGDAGTPGQIVNFGRDEHMKFVMARSLGRFLQWMADELEKEGRGGRRRWQGHFLDALPKLFGPPK
jgi:cell wall assembly regulator SMI1